ncbi:hypothetical protein P7C70_g4866, partial [Phenoliferia sp. Uapishka_3]
MAVGVGTVLSLVILVLAIFILLPSPPTPSTYSSRGNTITIPGPILAATSQGVTLDGLTIIPLVHLPTIKLSISIPFSDRRIFVRVSPTASEVVFKTLRIASFSTRALDACRDTIEVKVAGIDTDFTGSFGIKAVVRVARGNGKKEAEDGWSWSWFGSGRVKANLTDSRVSLNVKLVQKERQGPPRVEVVFTRVDEGDIHAAIIEGFGIWGGVATRAVPWVKGTWLVRWPTQVLADYLSKDILEGPVVDSILAEIFKVGEGHVDMESYEGLVDSERASEIATPLDSSVLSSSPTASQPTPDPKTPSTAPPLLPAPHSHKKFRLHSHLIGPTRLHSFPLPDYTPPLYRPGGTRAKLQSLNLLTSELQLSLTEISLARLTFSRGSLAFDRPRFDKPGSSLSGGEVVITVEDLTVLMAGDFSLGADTTPLLAWTTGIKRFNSSGTSTTTVLAHSLQLRIKLSRPSTTSRWILTEATMSPFTSVTPAFQLDNKIMDLGADLVNGVMKELRSQIAQAVSLLLEVWGREVVRKKLQEALDGVEEKLREAGVELPVGLRGDEDD